MCVCITLPCVVSHVDPHTYYSLRNVLTVPFNMADSYWLCATYSIYNNSINWHWSTAVGAIEGEEPTLATVVAVVDAKSARVGDT